MASYIWCDSIDRIFNTRHNYSTQLQVRTVAHVGGLVTGKGSRGLLGIWGSCILIGVLVLGCVPP